MGRIVNPKNKSNRERRKQCVSAKSPPSSIPAARHDYVGTKPGKLTFLKTKWHLVTE